MKGSSDLACLPRDLQPSLEEGPPAEPGGWPGWGCTGNTAWSWLCGVWGSWALSLLPLSCPRCPRQRVRVAFLFREEI